MSGFYKVKNADIPPGATPGNLDVHVLRQDAESIWLQTAMDPHPLEGVVPAEKLGSSWQAFWNAVPQEIRDAVFIARVKRGDEDVRCLLGAVEVGDKLLAVLPPHRFAGDPTERILA